MFVFEKEKTNTGVIFNRIHIAGILSRMPLGGLLPARSKTDHAKQLKELFILIENEQDKEKKNYEEVKFSNKILFIHKFYFFFFYLGNKKY